MDKKILASITLGTALVALGLFAVIRTQRLDNATPNDRVLVNALLTETETHHGSLYLIPEEEIYDSGLAPEDVMPLTNPKFTSVEAMDALLGDDLFGIDVEVDGVHRFYPEQILNWHRVVNDDTVLVTYDPLTGAAIVYETQRPSGEVVSLAFSGSVYNNGMLLEDSHGDLWWQMNGTLVVADRGQQVGEMLTQYPSQSMRWKDWKSIFPNGAVLSSETGFALDYTRHPYGQYEYTMNVYFPLNNTDSRIPGTKWAIDGVVINGEVLAVPKRALYNEPPEGSQADPGPRLYQTMLGGEAIVAFADSELDMTHVFSALVDDRTLTFYYDVDDDLFVDNETGSAWVASGLAIRGELQGTALTMINAPEYYWFAWAALYPETRVAVFDETPYVVED